MSVRPHSSPSCIPRVCGGEPAELIFADPDNGYSPRMRGMSPAEACYYAKHCCIPRVCGGEFGIRVVLKTSVGISPHLRSVYDVGTIMYTVIGVIWNLIYEGESKILPSS